MVELLVVIAIILALTSFAIIGITKAKSKANQAACMNNMRQIGMALQLYANDNSGVYPLTSHSTSEDQTWVFLLEDYIKNFDEVRICPADPKGKERRLAGGTSYILNSFVFVPPVDAFGEPDGPANNRPGNLYEPSRTITTFCCSDNIGVRSGDDHTHSDRWSSWSSVCADIATNRHGTVKNDPLKGSSNYLFADGHVENWTAMEVKSRIESGDNIATVPVRP